MGRKKQNQVTATDSTNVNIQLPGKFEFLFEPHRYKIAKGGRLGVKSWSFSRALLLIAVQPWRLWPGRAEGPRILCARETQKSIEESVHQLLKDQVESMGMQQYFKIQQTSISIPGNGAEFIFAGIRQHVNNMKSYEGCDIVWVEEAATVSKNSWNVLIPTIRKEGSEIWLSFNPELESDETYQRFIVKPPTDSVVVHTTFRDNPWLTRVMQQEMDDLKARNENDYNHVYEGQCKSTVEGAIYAKELAASDVAGRITRVPYDPSRPVYTYWDLGYGDATSIWYVQSFPFEFRIIDFTGGSLKGLAYYNEQLQSKGYVYGAHVLPHDGKAHELGTGKSIEETMRSIWGADKVKVARKLSIVDGINAVRTVFPKCYFDSEKASDGIQALRHYRYAFDEQLNTFKREPLHDWASHPADAFRTFAVSIKEEVREEPKEEGIYHGVSSNRPANDSAWMG